MDEKTKNKETKDVRGRLFVSFFILWAAYDLRGLHLEGSNYFATLVFTEGEQGLK